MNEKTLLNVAPPDGNLVGDAGKLFKHSRPNLLHRPKLLKEKRVMTVATICHLTTQGPEHRKLGTARYHRSARPDRLGRLVI